MPLTFPYTPGFTHGENVSAPVTVYRFLDASEQRYRGPSFLRRLSYEFPYVSSAMMAGITSFWLAHGGQRDVFTVVDHRTGTNYTARFGNATLDHQRGPHIRRSLRLDFLIDNSGTTPVPTSYTPPVVTSWGEVVTPGSGFIPGPTPVDPTSGNPQGAGFAVVGAWIPSGLMRGTATGQKRFVSENPWGWAMPFTVPRSGTTIDRMAMVVAAGADGNGRAEMAIYMSGSQTNFLPSSRMTAPCSVQLGSLGVQVGTLAAPLPLASNRLYYAAAQISSFTGFTKYVRGYGLGTSDPQTFPLGIAPDGSEVMAWVITNATSLPTTWPSSSQAYEDASGVPLIYLSVCS